MNGEEVLKDVIPNAFDSVEQLEEFSSRLKDDSYRKKLVVYFLI